MGMCACANNPHISCYCKGRSLCKLSSTLHHGLFCSSWSSPTLLGWWGNGVKLHATEGPTCGVEELLDSLVTSPIHKWHGVCVCVGGGDYLHPSWSWFQFMADIFISELSVEIRHALTVHPCLGGSVLFRGYLLLALPPPCCPCKALLTQ